MGLNQVVVFPGAPPAYGQVVELLAARGLTVQLRMIDGALAFPDEQPAEAWEELRVSVDGGMITLRRVAEKIVLVIWGNADQALVKAWNALTWSWAAAGGGLVVTPGEPVSAEEFARTADLPGFQGK